MTVEHQGRFSWYCPAHHLCRRYLTSGAAEVQARRHASTHRHPVLLSTLTWVEPEERLNGA